MACFDLKKLVVGRWWKCIEGKRDVIVDMQSWRPIFYWLNDWMMKKNWMKKELVVAMHSWVLTTNIYWLNDWMMEKYWSKKGSDRCYVVLTTNLLTEWLNDGKVLKQKRKWSLLCSLDNQFYWLNDWMMNKYWMKREVREENGEGKGEGGNGTNGISFN